IREIPEVDQVVSRIGSPEVATDPMSLEASDIYVSLKPRDVWRAGVTKPDLARELRTLLDASPEVGGAISQPIQMRTNELVAGIRSDVGVLIYGPDLGELSKFGEQVATAVKKVPG